VLPTSKGPAAGRNRCCISSSLARWPYQCWQRSFEINSGVILIMMAFLILHQATAIWDVQYASETREVSPTEQHVHSVLEMLPFTGLLLVIALHWPAFAALFGYGPPDFSFTLKQQPIPIAYVVSMLALTAFFEVLPYAEELARGLRHRQRIED